MAADTVQRLARPPHPLHPDGKRGVWEWASDSSDDGVATIEVLHRGICVRLAVPRTGYSWPPGSSPWGCWPSFFSARAPASLTERALHCTGEHATTSISTRAPRGRPATATVVRAGYGAVKNPAYAPFIASKSRISMRYTLTLTTSSRSRPAADRMDATFSNTWRVCAATSPSISCPVDGSIGVWPERYNVSSRPNAAWE